MLFLIVVSYPEAKKETAMKIETKEFFNENIVDLAIENAFYKKEIVTGPHGQVLIMCIPIGEQIGEEAHDVDQIIIFVQGNGHVIINDVISEVHPNHLVLVPAGTKHNVKNMGLESLKLFTIYAPAEAAIGTLEEKKSIND